MNRKKLKEELTYDEGLRLEAYKDSVGLWTIGVGHLLGTSKRMSEVTKEEAMSLLEADIDRAEATVMNLVPTYPTWGTENELRARALVNMAFNLGNRLGEFHKFLAAVNDWDWERASRCMMQSKWAGQVGPRAVRLRNMVLTAGDTGLTLTKWGE
jgi:lysozyme